jgi:hypothetical protein
LRRVVVAAYWEAGPQMIGRHAISGTARACEVLP